MSLIFSLSGFSVALDSIDVDANTVTSMNILAKRASSVKLYVITITLGMCMTFRESLVLSFLTRRLLSRAG